MTYLYGDSSASPLRQNFIEFVRDALDFAVHVEVAGQRLVDGKERLQAWKQATEVEVRRLESLDAAVGRALAAMPTGAADSPTARCAAAIARTVTGLVRGEVEAEVARLADEMARLDGQGQAEREGCFRALEKLLLRHDLPETTSAPSLRITEGAPYQARLYAQTPFGLSSTIELSVGANHLFSHPLRIDKVEERLEVQAPEETGWLQKKVTVRPQRLDKFHLAELGPAVLKLRALPDGAGDGFDVLYGERVRLARIADDGKAVGDPFDVVDEDAAKLSSLRDKLLAAAADLATQRSALAAASLDDKPFQSHAEPTALVERLVQAIAPTVREIARRSLTPGELVLKRLLGDGRREEVFVTKAELRARIDKVPETRRALFDALALAETVALAPSPPPVAVAAAVVAQVVAPPVPRPVPRPPMPPPQPAPRPAEASAPGIPLDEGAIVVMEADSEEDHAQDHAPAK